MHAACLFTHNVGVSGLDARIDDLYQESLDNFIDARTALAKTLTGADAQRVRKLTKPTVVPWAVNQVYWRARSTFDALIKSGERLRKAQVAALEGRSSDVRGATDEHRRAITDAVKEAERLAAAEGSKPPTDALMRTLEALSMSTEPAERPGRLTRPLQPAGFEALGDITLKAPAPPKEPRRPSKKEEAARQKAEAAEKKRQAAIRKAEAALARARRRVAAAEAELRETRERE